MEQEHRGNGGREVRRTAPQRTRSGTVSPRKVWFVIGTLLLIFAVTGIMIGGIFMVYVKTTLGPTLKVNADDYTMNLSSVIYYQDKTSGEWTELQTIHGRENRIWVDYDQIPEAMSQAAIAIEDKRFESHHGVDWKRTIGATGAMFLGRNATYGGSTITQQLLKNMTGDDQNTVKRKVTEIFRALEFEKNYSKEQILELYLNTIYLGNGCYGVQTGAQYYFGKDVSELTVAECADLIGITNNPSVFSPIRNDKTKVNNKTRQENILAEMKDQGYIDETVYNEAVAETLHFTDGTTTADELVAAAEADEGGSSAKYNSYFVDQVIRDVVSDMVEQLGVSEETAKARIYHSGYNIYTTIDPAIQEIAESVYADRGNLKNLTSKSGQLIRSGITIVDVTNGAVVAMVGDMGEKEGDLVWNYATGTRQCGSSIKPLTVYAPALDANAITMASTFDNYPVRLLNGNPWPKNSPQGYTGWTTLSTGVAKSINTVAVQVVEKLGISNSYQFATEKLGLQLVSDDKNTAALGLGGLTHGLNTEEMAAAYASFANEGIYNEPHLYTKVEDGDGNVILESEVDSHVAMKDTTAYFMNELLQGVVSGGTGSSASFSGMALAGKTGTTSENYDRYFVGYSPYYCAAVWTGYKVNEKISYSGNPSVTLWKKVMQQVHEGLDYRSFSKPTGGLTTVRVCKDSGLLATDACAMDARESRVREVQVVAGTGPTDSCNLHVVQDYCTEGKCLAGPGCPADTVEQRSFLDYVRTDYGGILADDNAYLLSTLETVPECPVHGGAAPVEPDPDPDPDNPQQPGGDVDNVPPGEEGTIVPPEPNTPSEPTTGGDWWNGFLGNT